MSSLRSHKPRADDPLEDRDPPSGLPDGLGMTVRCLMTRGEDAAKVRAGITKTGLRIEEVRQSEDALRDPVPPMAIVDMGAPQASLVLTRLSRSTPRCWAMAMARNSAQEAEALCAGAEVVMRSSPIDADVVALQLERLRERAFQIVTARHATERDTVLARAESVGQFATGLTREIYEPLSVAAVNVKLLRQLIANRPLTTTADELGELADDLAHAVDKMHHLVSEMREFVRADARPLEVVRLADVVEEALALIPNARQIPIGVTISTDERAVARRELLEKVMDTLLANAIGAMGPSAQPLVAVRVYRYAGEPRISVRDNGPAIPTELRDRIFQPFYHPRGVPRGGVGLAVCREFIARMGGALSLAPAGHGTCFRIQLRSV